VLASAAVSGMSDRRPIEPSAVSYSRGRIEVAACS